MWLTVKQEEPRGEVREWSAVFAESLAPSSVIGEGFGFVFESSIMRFIASWASVNINSRNVPIRFGVWIAASVDVTRGKGGRGRQSARPALPTLMSWHFRSSCTTMNLGEYSLRISHVTPMLIRLRLPRSPPGVPVDRCQIMRQHRPQSHPKPHSDIYLSRCGQTRLTG